MKHDTIEKPMAGEKNCLDQSITTILLTFLKEANVVAIAGSPDDRPTNGKTLAMALR
jgi:hypothetical protein